MTEPFEVRHRALREAITARNADLAAPYLRDFDERTGPLVDDLVAAARGMQKFGQHEGECRVGEDGKCELHVRAFQRRGRTLEAALTALDEATSG